MEQRHTPTETLSSTSEILDTGVFEAPRAGMEQVVAQVWTDVFSQRQVGRNDNFFELGGNSLLGMDLTEMLADRLGIQVSVVTLFQNPTVRELARAIDAEREF